MLTSHLNVLHNRGFRKLDEIGNNANIGIREFTTWKQKKIQWKMLPLVGKGLS